MTGILNLDKPPGISSARAVDRVKRLWPRGTKIGHAGTLDPFATGVLLLLIGRATKACERLMDAPKQYEATVRLGATTATDDPERPPAFSAMKVDGRRAYDLARKGWEVALNPRPVRVYRVELLDYAWPDLR